MDTNASKVITRAGLTDEELWQCLCEAEARKADNSLPMDVRIRSFQTFSLCLHAAHERGLGYEGLRAMVEGGEDTAFV